MNRILELNQLLNEAVKSIELDGNTEAKVQKSAVSLSKRNKGKYVTVYVDFGQAYAKVHGSLNVFSPTDSTFKWYVLNGKVKKFSDKQKVADQNNTPTMT